MAHALVWHASDGVASSAACACSDQRKLLHTLLNALAVTAAVLGVIAAFNSHTLKRPVPTANLYSPHSYLGIFTLAMLGLQASGPPRWQPQLLCEGNLAPVLFELLGRNAV